MTNRLPPRLARWTLPLAIAAACCLAWPAAVAAQDEQTTPAKPATARPPAPKPAGEPAAPADTAREERQQASRERQIAHVLPNIKVDVTITDQSGTGKPVTKTLSAIMSDRMDASIRTVVQVPTPLLSNPTDPKAAPVWRTVGLPLNVDLRSELTDTPSVARVGLSLNYGTAPKPGDAGTAPQDYSAEITQRFNVFLESGKPLIISQSADAATDRKVTIELKATILR